ncbi:prenyltransferase/squalene oxidase repeat-containing protein [Calycomorphotria hydatis]|uniref:Prenyltransferase and squalene oxidase repeat protein n=1 Tax=Calycomorphotria hydatis TaxID=2528027 RepID=A0A517TBJ2_9PLAN|nr:prenyltransferase/squalene oxidase repeat-containing protein [Calycomorphotria hydatis]QDT65739.1 Prenyltransferase and squalene oxidase repeat protein [Calycomorphotria hydatis]
MSIDQLDQWFTHPLMKEILDSSAVYWLCALGIISFVALMQFTSMLLTRWGDRGASTKAFVFSVLVHVSLFCGTFASAPILESVLFPEKPTEISVPIQIGSLPIEQEKPDEESPLDDLKVWERPLESTSKPERERQELERELAELEDVKPEFEPENKLTPEQADDIPEQPRHQQETPELTQSPEKSPELATADSLPLDQETASAREEVLPDVDVTSRSTSTSNPRELTPQEIERQSGSAARIMPKPEESRTVLDATPSSLPQPDAIPEQPTELITRATGPDTLGLEQALPEGGLAQRSESENSRPAPNMVPSRRTRTSTKDFALGPNSVISRPSNDSREPSLLARIDRRPIEDNLPTRPNTTRESPELAKAPSSNELQRTIVPPTYQLRNLATRSEVAKERGGTDESERAVEAALQWFASHQNDGGYWDADKHGSGLVKLDENGIDRRNAGKTADSGLTALIVLSFLGAGYTQDDGQYSDEVNKAINWLISRQKDDGYLGGDAAHYEMMYCHGMVTFALAEAYAMQVDKTQSQKLRNAVVKGVRYIVDRQNTDGGWRYDVNQAGDMSMFGWQLMALKSASVAGIPIARTTQQSMIRFLKDRSLGDDGGLAGYLETMPPSSSMTAEALFCKQMLGLKPDNPASQEAVQYLMARLPKRTELDLYYWYYGTLAMYQHGGEQWQAWNSAVREVLVADQLKSGENSGSWDPTGPWGRYGGRLYSTALSTLCLEAYYRFLPLYRSNPAGDDS